MGESPALSYTPQGDVSSIAEEARRSFLSHTTRPLEYRLVQLRKLYWGITDNATALKQACKKDLNKAAFETTITEIDFSTVNVILTLKNLAKWIKDETAPDQPITNWPMSPKIRKDPMGCVLIIGTFNFPVQLVLCPLIGAIAAGCTAVVKPSENAPAVAAVVQRIIESTLDSACYKVVQGAVPETSLLLDQKWDKIFYTGSARVGTIIAKKAAETLTPVTLELGGRNPAIVTKHANCYTATRRLLWGKTLNAGQVCISQNYTLVDETVLDQFITELKTAISEFYPNGAQSSPDYAHIVNRESFDRITSLLSSSEGKVLAGGTSDPSTLFIAPTIVLLSSPTDPILSSESFGPLLPILPYSSLDSAIKLANDIHCTPLALAAFGSSTEYAQILNEIRSGGASLNDNYLHGSLPTLPFGGVGDSGQGNYRGRASFECFTHRRTVTNTPNWVEGLLKVRYPPFTDANLKKMRQLTATTPWFDREGTVTVTWLGWLLRLGAEGNAGGVARYVVLVLAAIGLRRYWH